MKDDDIKPRESVIEFPCKFPIKVIGDARDDFAQAVLNACQTQIADITADAITMRPSKTNKYIALTVTVAAESQAQLDAIYLAINQLSGLKMVL